MRAIFTIFFVLYMTHFASSQADIKSDSLIYKLTIQADSYINKTSKPEKFKVLSSDFYINPLLYIFIDKEHLKYYSFEYGKTYQVKGRVYYKNMGRWFF